MRNRRENRVVVLFADNELASLNKHVDETRDTRSSFIRRLIFAELDRVNSAYREGATVCDGDG